MGPSCQYEELGKFELANFEKYSYFFSKILDELIRFGHFQLLS